MKEYDGTDPIMQRFVVTINNMVFVSYPEGLDCLGTWLRLRHVHIPCSRGPGGQLYLVGGLYADTLTGLALTNAFSCGPGVRMLTHSQDYM